MKATPYLHYNGDCAAAFKYYEQELGGKIIVSMTHAETPIKDQMPADWLDKIIHARIAIGDTVIMGSDSPPQHYHTPGGFSITLNVDSSEDAERTFKALSDGGEVIMAMEETFFAYKFGMCRDKFSMPWMVIYEKSMSA